MLYSIPKLVSPNPSHWTGRPNPRFSTMDKKQKWSKKSSTYFPIMVEKHVGRERMEPHGNIQVRRGHYRCRWEQRGLVVGIEKDPHRLSQPSYNPFTDCPSWHQIICRNSGPREFFCSEHAMSLRSVVSTDHSCENMISSTLSGLVANRDIGDFSNTRDTYRDRDKE